MQVCASLVQNINWNAPPYLSFCPWGPKGLSDACLQDVGQTLHAEALKNIQTSNIKNQKLTFCTALHPLCVHILRQTREKSWKNSIGDLGMMEKVLKLFLM